MSTLLLRLAGPMQSWGTQSRFSERDTGLEPSKSGVIGLICAALGRPREADIADLAALRMGVRVEREGVMQADYHTAMDVPDSEGKNPRTVLSHRYYLADADFLVGLDGERALLEAIEAALRRPRWQLALGRKAFVPSVPVHLPEAPPWGPGIRDEPLEQALATYPWLGEDPLTRRPEWEVPPETLRLVIEDEAGDGGEQRMDVPLSFAARRFGPRRVHTRRVGTPATVTTQGAGS